MKELLAALHAVMDARLVEHGLLEAPKGTKATTKKAAPPADEPADEDTEINFDTLKEKITNLVKSKGKEAAKTLLTKFKVGKLGDLPEAKFAKLDAELDKALAAEDDDSGSDDLFGD